MNTLYIDAFGVTQRAWDAANSKRAKTSGSSSRPNSEDILQSLVKKINEAFPEAAHKVAIMDGPGSGSERRRLFDGYKAQRADKEAGLKRFLRQAPAIYSALGCDCVQSTGGFESNDVFAVLVKKTLEESPTSTVTIFSSDKYLQALLADKRVSLFTFGEEDGSVSVIEKNAESIEIKLKVKVNQLADYLSIKGDKADGIPGAEGISEAGAASLLSEYKTVNAILDAAEKKTLNKTFTKAFTEPLLRQRFELSRELVRLRLEATYEPITITAPEHPAPIECPPLSTTDRVKSDLRNSGIPGEYIHRMGCVPFSQAEIAAIAGWPPDSISAEGGYGIPYPGQQAHDGGTFYRLKHFGHPKYLSMKGHSPEIYVPIDFEANRKASPGILFIVEGEKKAAAMDALGLPTLGIPGTSAWFDTGYRERDKSEYSTLSEDTLPHRVIREAALKARWVIVVGDSDIEEKPQAAIGISTLRRALQKWVDQQTDCLMLDPTFDPIVGNRTITVLSATVPTVYQYVRDEDSSDPEASKLVLPKVGADDFILQLLAEYEQSYKPKTMDDITEMRGKVAVRLRATLRAIALFEQGKTDTLLARLMADEQQHCLALKQEKFMLYRPQTGAWVPDESQAKFKGPASVAEIFIASAPILAALQAKRMKIFGGWKKDDLPSEVRSWQENFSKRLGRFSGIAESLQNVKTCWRRSVRVPFPRADQRHAANSGWRHWRAIAGGSLIDKPPRSPAQGFASPSLPSARAGMGALSRQPCGLAALGLDKTPNPAPRP